MRLAVGIFSGALIMSIPAMWISATVGIEPAGGFLLGLAFGGVGSVLGGLLCACKARKA